MNAKQNSVSRINRAWSRQITTESFKTETGWKLKERWTKAHPMTGREMNRALYQNGLFWTLAGYGRGWRNPYHTPKLDRNKKYIIACDLWGYLEVREI